MLSLLLSMGLATSAHAISGGGLFVEPSITYESGETDVNYPSPFSNSTGDLEGFGLGARLGFHVSEVIFLGLDARYSMAKFKDSSVSYNSESTAFNWGPVLGMQMPIVGLRIWGSYILDSELDPEKDGNFDVKFTKGTGYRVGAGFRLTAVSLNLEYQQLNYDSASLQQAGPFSGNFDNVELESQLWIVSVSFPMEF